MAPAPGAAGASVLGLLSGFFGGAAGNQGGLRAAALLTFTLSPLAFVATSTAVGLIVDAVRLPIYMLNSGTDMLRLAWLIGVASIGAVIGTLLGERLLFGLSPVTDGKNGTNKRAKETFLSFLLRLDCSHLMY